MVCYFCLFVLFQLIYVLLFLWSISCSIDYLEICCLNFWYRSPLPTLPSRRWLCLPRMQILANLPGCLHQGLWIWLNKTWSENKIREWIGIYELGSANTETTKVTGSLETKYRWTEYGLTFTEKWNTDKYTRHRDYCGRSACTWPEADLRFILLTKHWEKKC